MQRLKNRKVNTSDKNNPSLYNMILNKNEITQGKRVLESKPRGLAITLTNKCNIRCIMCSVWQATWDIPKKTVKEITELFPYLQRLFWQGGEVFLSPYFAELFEKVSAYPHIRQDINTNGLLINKEWAKKLVQANVNIIFSIDGVTKETYEYIRRDAHWEDLLKNIDILNKYMEDVPPDTNHTGRRCSTVINLVVMRSNYRQLGGFIDFAQKYRFSRLQITPVDIGNQENIFLHRDEEALAYIDKVMPEIFEKAKEYGISVSNWLPSMKQEQNAKQEDNNEQREKSNGILCYWPWQFLFIDWGGKVRPQCFCIKEVGNINNYTLEEIWNNDMMQTYRQKLLHNDCLNWCGQRCISGTIAKEDLSLD